MRRGDFVSIAIQGDYGKPRPALVIQADLFNEHASVTVLPVTSTLIDAPCASQLNRTTGTACRSGHR